MLAVFLSSRAVFSAKNAEIKCPILRRGAEEIFSTGFTGLIIFTARNAENTGKRVVHLISKQRI
jgi:hypothetical protein